MEIQHVQEIRSFEPPTPLPNAPAHVIGVINLRGTIVPVVDLRRRLGLPAVAARGREVTVILRLGELAVGIALDSVTEVIQPMLAQLRVMPNLGPDVDPSDMRAIVAIDARMIVLLDAPNLARDVVVHVQ